MLQVYTLPKGMGIDSSELLQKEEETLNEFYTGSATIKKLVQKLFTARPATITAHNAFLNKTLHEIRSILTWEFDSDDSPAPKLSAIIHAEKWISRLFFQVGLENWLKPNVTTGPEGEVVFEWWFGKKKLTIYISSQEAEYVKVWGIDIYEDMANGNAKSIETCKEIWTWLRS